MTETKTSSKTQTIFSGMRPTGKLHLGTFWGALSRWVDLQNTSGHRCFFMVADLHALTTGYEDTKELKANVEDMVLDVSGLAREAVVLGLPELVVCTAECKGLCPDCGQDLNRGLCECVPTPGDERWEKLRDLVTVG